MNKKITIINTTSETVNIITDSIITYEPSLELKIKEESDVIGILNNIEIYKKRYKINLSYNYNVFYIVSLETALKFPFRSDFIVPNNPIYNEINQIIGYNSFIKL